MDRELSTLRGLAYYHPNLQRLSNPANNEKKDPSAQVWRRIGRRCFKAMSVKKSGFEKKSMMHGRRPIRVYCIKTGDNWGLIKEVAQGLFWANECEDWEAKG